MRTMIAVLQILAWEWLNPFLLRLRRNRTYHPDPSVRGINLGCGIDNPPDWLGIDGGLYVVLASLPPWLVSFLFKIFPGSNVSKRRDFIIKMRSTRIIHHEFAYGLPLKDCSVVAAYSSHFFEHLGKDEAIRLIRECYRVMKPGGVIRICVPDLEEEVQKMKAAIANYDSGNSDPIQKFVTTKTEGYVSKYSNHRHMYNFEGLRKILESCGFSDVCQYTMGVGRIQDVERLDTRGGLHVEGLKPHSPIT